MICPVILARDRDLECCVAEAQHAGERLSQEDPARVALRHREENYAAARAGSHYGDAAARSDSLRFRAEDESAGQTVQS